MRASARSVCVETFIELRKSGKGWDQERVCVTALGEKVHSSILTIRQVRRRGAVSTAWYDLRHCASSRGIVRRAARGFSRVYAELSGCSTQQASALYTSPPAHGKLARYYHASARSICLPGRSAECFVKAPVAQLDRVPGFEPGGRRFESFRARHQSPFPYAVLSAPAGSVRWLAGVTRYDRQRDRDASHRLRKALRCFIGFSHKHVA